MVTPQTCASITKVGQGVKAHCRHADNLIQRLRIHAESEELVRHCAAEDLGAAEGRAGDRGEHVRYDHGRDVGVHLIRHQHSQIHKVLEARTGVNDGGKPIRAAVSSSGLMLERKPVMVS